MSHGFPTEFKIQSHHIIPCTYYYIDLYIDTSHIWWSFSPYFFFLAEVAWCELHRMFEALMEKPGNSFFSHLFLSLSSFHTCSHVFFTKLSGRSPMCGGLYQNIFGYGWDVPDNLRQQDGAFLCQVHLRSLDAKGELCDSYLWWFISPGPSCVII